MKKIILSGGTGLIGSKLSKLLVDSGYEVVILTRNPSRFKPEHNITYSKIDLADLNNSISILENAYSIINLAGAGVADKKWTPEYKKEIYDSRINLTSHLVEAINRTENKPNSFISASAIGIYGDRGDEQLNEKSQATETFLANVCVDWEKVADRCGDSVRVVKSRIGIVLARNGGALPKMLMPYKLFVGGALGSGNQWMSWIHIDDICNLFLWCIENNDALGVFNFTAPNPVTMNYFSYHLGKTIKRPSIFKVPAFVLKLILGESAEVVLASQRVYPTEALHLGFKFNFENLNLALNDILK